MAMSGAAWEDVLNEWCAVTMFEAVKKSKVVGAESSTVVGVGDCVGHDDVVRIGSVIASLDNDVASL